MYQRIASALAVTSAVLFAGCTTTPQGGPPPAPSLGHGLVAPKAEPPSRYGNPPEYEVFGQRYQVMASSEGYRERGIASWYGTDFHGKRTSSGTPYDMYALSAAHKSLPLPTYVQVTHLGNGKSVVVRVDDRGPFVDGRIIDLSYSAARALDMVGPGTAEVEVVALPPYQYLPGAALARPSAPPPAYVQAALPAPTPARPPAPQYLQPAPAPAPVSIPAAAPPPPAPQGAGARSYWLQVGAFTERHNADRLQARLATQLARDIRVREAEDRLFRVQVGPLADPGEAAALVLQLGGAGVGNPRLVQD